MLRVLEEQLDNSVMTATHARPSIFILGDYRQTLTVARTLHDKGFRTIVGSLSGPVTYCLHSRATCRAWNPDHSSAYRSRVGSSDHTDALLGFLKNNVDIEWIFPIGDNDVHYVQLHKNEFPDHVGVIAPDEKITRLCHDKTSCYELAADCRIPVAPYRPVRDSADLYEAFDAFGCPLVLKPAEVPNEFVGENAYILSPKEDENQSELMEYIGSGATLLAQKYFHGQRINCQFFAKNGVLEAYFEQLVIRTTRANLTGYCTEGISKPPSDRLQKHCKNLLAKLGYSGVGCIQFLVSESTSDIAFLELNPRLDANCTLALYCGYDFPRMALDHARKGNSSEADINMAARTYPSNRRSIWVTGAVEGVVHELRRHKINAIQAWYRMFHILRAVIISDVHITWSWKDPIPTLYILYTLATKPIHKFIKTHKPKRSSQ